MNEILTINQAEYSGGYTLVLLFSSPRWPPRAKREITFFIPALQIHLKYGESDNEICGILFDGAWLWEEYVNTILTDHGFVHLQNKIGKGKIFLFEDIDEFGNKHKSGIRYPDFYKDDFVLDAKYKRLGSYDKVSKVDREDIHQIIKYMNNLNASRGGFVSPIESKQEKNPTSHLNNVSSTNIL